MQKPRCESPGRNLKNDIEEIAWLAVENAVFEMEDFAAPGDRIASKAGEEDQDSHRIAQRYKPKVSTRVLVVHHPATEGISR